MSEQTYDIAQLVLMLKDKINESPEDARQALNAMLIESAAQIDQSNPDTAQFVALRAMALALTQNTGTLNLELPPYGAPADIMVINQNFQKIDDFASATIQAYTDLDADQIAYSNSDLPGVKNVKQALDTVKEN